MRVRQTSPHPYIPWSEMLSWKGQWLGAGVKGLWSNPRARAAVDCREMDQGDVREETVMVSACGGKPGSHGSKVIQLSPV